MTSRARVLTASTRAAAGIYPDRGGPVAAAALAALGFAVDPPVVVPDGPEVERELRRAVADGVEVVVTTGGTGISPTDTTPEATRRVIDREVPGIAEALRAQGRTVVPTAALSRGLAGVAGSTLIVNLPGSPGGVRDGVAVLAALLPHAVDQISGGDHPASVPATLQPPAGVVVWSEVTDSPLPTEELVAAVTSRGSGAVVTFLGVVRDHDHGRSVTSLSYSGHPGAGQVLAEVAGDAARLAGVEAVAVAHRLGDLAVGEVALAAAVSGPHRQQVFASCSWLVDEVKRRLPVWKRQTFTDGTDEWVNCP